VFSGDKVKAKISQWVFPNIRARRHKRDYTKNAPDPSGSRIMLVHCLLKLPSEALSHS